MNPDDLPERGPLHSPDFDPINERVEEDEYYGSEFIDH